MEVKKFSVSACCGKTAIAFKLNTILSKTLLNDLVSKGFVESKHFTAAGMMYVENQSIIASGTFGSDILNVKCKISNCSNFVDEFESLLANIE